MTQRNKLHPSASDVMQKGKAKPDAQSNFNRELLPSTAHQHASAVSLIDKMKSAASPEDKIALLSPAAHDPMALAWFAILYQEEKAVSLEAVRSIGSDIPALHEICWRSSIEGQKEVREAAILKLGSLMESTLDLDTPLLVALYSPDPLRRELAAGRLIESGDALKISSCATHSGFEDTRKTLLQELIRMKDLSNIRSVASFCRYETTSGEAIAALARLGDFDSLMTVFSHSSLKANRISAIDAAAAFGSERILCHDDAHGIGYVFFLRHAERILESMHEKEHGLPSDRFTLLDSDLLRIVGTAKAILADDSWDAGHLDDHKIRVNRLLYRMMRVRKDFEEDDWNPRMGSEINDLLRNKLGLNAEQTADMEWKPDARMGKPAGQDARSRL